MHILSSDNVYSVGLSVRPLLQTRFLDILFPVLDLAIKCTPLLFGSFSFLLDIIEHNSVDAKLCFEATCGMRAC